MAGKNITELSEKDFKSFTKKGIVVVDFWATWCGPCKLMAPVFDEASEELKGKVKFGKVDVDKHSELAQEYEVLSIPTLIIFNDGKQVERSIGSMSKEDLLELIENAK